MLSCYNVKRQMQACLLKSYLVYNLCCFLRVFRWITEFHLLFLKSFKYVLLWAVKSLLGPFEWVPFDSSAHPRARWRLFILQGVVSRSSPSEVSRRYVHCCKGRRSGKTGKGAAVRDGEGVTRALKLMFPYRAAESQGVPVTQRESFADSLSGC